jgi:mannose-1-phosphate guanylyltransferase
MDGLPLRFVLAQTSRPPTLPPQNGRVRAVIERDSREYRGTGGVLRDAAVAYEPDDVILVANGAQVLLEPLPVLAAELCDAGGSVSFVGHRDGTPCALYLIRCGALTGIRDIGFLDFKEQVLPKLGAAGHQVRAVLRDSATAISVRTLDGYLSAVRTFARIAAGLSSENDPFAEDWKPTFSLVESGALVKSSATVHDSVVLKGARIEEGALVVRSVIGPGAMIRASDTVADRAYGASGEITDEEGER